MSQEVSPFPACDHKEAMNRRESMTNTRHKHQMIHKERTALEQSVKSILLDGFNRFHSANLTINSDVDQDT